MQPNPTFEPGQPPGASNDPQPFGAPAAASDLPQEPSPVVDPESIYPAVAERGPARISEPALHQPPQPALDSADGQPVPVVRVLSVKGVEYGMMTLTLWVAATAVAWVLLNLLNGSGGFDPIVVPVSSLVVCLPVFLLLFIRLKKAELRHPEIRLDASKRRWSQTTQFLAFIACIVNLIYFVYTLLQRSSGGQSQSIGKSVMTLLVILVIAGGVLAYYWHDEHRARKA